MEKIVTERNIKILLIGRTNTGINCKKRQIKKLISKEKKEKKQKMKHKKKKKRISLNTEFTILKQALIHGENWEFKGQVLYIMI